MATPVVGPAESQQQISDFGRVAGVLFSPDKTFTDIAHKPSWVLPAILLTILGLGVVFFLNQKMDWTSYIRQQAEKSAAWDQLSEEQKDQRVTVGAKIAAPSAWVFGAIGPMVLILFLALVYMVAFNVLSGAQLRYGVSMGITAFALMPAAIGSILTMIVLAMKPYGTVAPDRLLATSLAVLLPTDAPRWELTLANSFELFWIWSLVLLAIGFRAANRKKISSGAAFGTVFVLWLIWVLARTGLAAM
jgi:Yip1 domain